MTNVKFQQNRSELHTCFKIINLCKTIQTASKLLGLCMYIITYI